MSQGLKLVFPGPRANKQTSSGRETLTMTCHVVQFKFREPSEPSKSDGAAKPLSLPHSPRLRPRLVHHGPSLINTETHRRFGDFCPPPLRLSPSRPAILRSPRDNSSCSPTTNHLGLCQVRLPESPLPLFVCRPSLRRPDVGEIDDGDAQRCRGQRASSAADDHTAPAHNECM